MFEDDEYLMCMRTIIRVISCNKASTFSSFYKELGLEQKAVPSAALIAFSCLVWTIENE